MLKMFAIFTDQEIQRLEEQGRVFSILEIMDKLFKFGNYFYMVSWSCFYTQCRSCLEEKFVPYTILTVGGC